jgi:hypothetical protein
MGGGDTQDSRRDVKAVSLLDNTAECIEKFGADDMRQKQGDGDALGNDLNTGPRPPRCRKPHIHISGEKMSPSEAAKECNPFSPYFSDRRIFAIETTTEPIFVEDGVC